jgi:hypothetical protein
MKRDDDKPATWRPPTRRAFVAMLGAAAASLASRDVRRAIVSPTDDPPRSTWAGTTRWIGHC